MSEFFQSEIVREELDEINKMQAEVYGNMMTFGTLNPEDQKEHIDMLIELLEKERGESIDVPKSSKMDWSIVRDKIAKHGMRNSNVIAIAPTATISNIMGSSPCIEPTYKNLFVKSNLSGDFLSAL